MLGIFTRFSKDRRSMLYTRDLPFFIQRKGFQTTRYSCDEMYFLLGCVAIVHVLVLWSGPVLSVTVEEIHCAVYTCDDQRCHHTLQTDHLPNLDISYNCSHPDVVFIASKFNRSIYFKLFHSSVCITRLPGDICNYPNTVSIKIVNSSIHSISNLSCLKELTDLDLSHNDIVVLRNDTFRGLSKLRNIDLRHNRISSIQRDTFTEDLQGLMYVWLDDNSLTTADAWPMKIGHPFCLFSISNNKITRFSNKEDWQIDPTKKYGPGWYDFKGNLFSSWVSEELKIFGITELKMLGFLIEWVFDFRNNPWICDCKFYTFLFVSSNYPDLVGSDHFNLVCNSPAHLHGTRVVDVRPLDRFVCNVTDKCPTECLCQDHPAKHQLLVDCRSRGLIHLPEQLPTEYRSINLLLSENSIRSLQLRPYLHKVINLDLSLNRLTYVDSEALDVLQHKVTVMNISHNDLKYLPTRIQDILHVTFDHNPFICDCNSTWMARWMNLLSKSQNVSSITCKHPDKGILQASKADDSVLQCPPHQLVIILSSVFGSIVLICVIVVIILVVFRFEISILVNDSTSRKHQNQEADDFEHDVFISVNDDSEADRLWVIRHLLPGLEIIHHLKVYFPPRDTVPGTVMADEFIKAMKKSRTALIVLSQRYVDSPSKVFEFSMAYDAIVKTKQGRLIIVKFPGVGNNIRGHLKAFMRLKKYINVDEKDWLKKILKSIKRENGQIDDHRMKVYATKI